MCRRDELAATLQRLDQFLFSEDVQLADLSGTLEAVWIHGPEAAALLDQTLTGVQGLAGWPEYQNARAGVSSKMTPDPMFRSSSHASASLAFLVSCVYVEPSGKADLERALVERGARRSPTRPRSKRRGSKPDIRCSAIDMTDDTIPLEAGIEERAISFSKGCYVGQEVIIRVLHRGHGRVARKLVALRLVGGSGPPGARRFCAGDRDVGA